MRASPVIRQSCVRCATREWRASRLGRERKKRASWGENRKNRDAKPKSSLDRSDPTLHREVPPGRDCRAPMKLPVKNREADTFGTSRAARSGLRPSVSRARDRERVVDRKTCPPEDPGYVRANPNLHRRVESASARPAVAAPRSTPPRSFLRPSPSSRSFSSRPRGRLPLGRGRRDPVSRALPLTLSL